MVAPAFAVLQSETICRQGRKQIYHFGLIALLNGKNIRRILNDFIAIKFFNNFASKSFNIKGIARDKVFEPLNDLGRTG